MQVVADQPGERLDVAVARLCDLSRAQAQRLIDEGLVRATARVRVKAGDQLAGGERLTVRVPPPVPAEPQPEAMPLTIVYEDEHLIVVDKPAGMPVHPGPGHCGPHAGQRAAGALPRPAGHRRRAAARHRAPARQGHVGPDRRGEGRAQRTTA